MGGKTLTWTMTFSQEQLAAAYRLTATLLSQSQLNSPRIVSLAEVEQLGWFSAIRESGEAQVFPIRLDAEEGTQYWLGYRNFWVISRYNRAIAYSMAVFQLAEALEQK